nr:MAG TPA: HNH endonuclease [Caudoviricetes sp.]
MPYKPKTPCRYPGCPKLSAERFCPQHTQVEDQRYRRYQRDPEINRRYGTVWRKIRTRYLDAHTLCEDCLKAGHTTPALEVHHVVPLSHGGSHDVSNLRALCKPCHSRQSARDGDRWRNASQVFTYHENVHTKA